MRFSGLASNARALLGLNVLLFAGGVGLLVFSTVASIRFRAVAVFAAIIVLVPTSITLAWLTRQYRSLAVVNGSLRIARGLGSRSIALTSVTGVGLLFQYRFRSMSGWYLTIWDDVGDQHVLEQFVLAAPGWQLPQKQEPKLPHEDSQQLQSSRPGQIARQLFDLAMNAQGPTGLLATEHRQTRASTDPYGTTQTIAYWSPDGNIGRVS